MYRFTSKPNIRVVNILPFKTLQINYRDINGVTYTLLRGHVFVTCKIMKCCRLCFLYDVRQNKHFGKNITQIENPFIIRFMPKTLACVGYCFSNHS